MAVAANDPLARVSREMAGPRTCAATEHHRLICGCPPSREASFGVSAAAAVPPIEAVFAEFILSSDRSGDLRVLVCERAIEESNLLSS